MILLSATLLLIALYPRSCFTITVSVQVEMMGEQCEVRLDRFAGALKGREIEAKIDIQSLDTCIGTCRQNAHTKKCNAVAYSAQQTTCVLFELDERYDTITTTDDSFGRFLFRIEACRELTETDEMVMSMHPTKVRVPAISKSCEMYKMETGKILQVGFRSVYQEVPDLEKCAATCEMDYSGECMGVYYTHDRMECRHFEEAIRNTMGYEVEQGITIAFIQHCSDMIEEPDAPEIPSPETGVSGVVDNGEKETGTTDSSSAESEDSNQMESVTIGTEDLYYGHEICTVEVKSNGLLRRHRVIGEYRRIRSRPECIFLCTNEMDEKCSGIKYTTSSQSCITLKKVRTAQGIKVNKGDYASIVKSCEEVKHPRGVSVAENFQIYLFLHEEICQVATYIKTDILRGWEYIERDTLISSFDECIEICRVLWSVGCRAVTFTEERKCSTIKMSVDPKQTIELLRKKPVFRVINCHRASIKELFQK